MSVAKATEIIIPEMVDKLQTGSVSVGVTITDVVDANVAATHQVYIKSDKVNTGVIYIGTASTITAGTAGTTDGYPLNPGESISLLLSNVNLLQAIASIAAQKLFWLAY